MLEKINYTLTDGQISEIKKINVTTRYEAIEQVAKIINAETSQRPTWASSRKMIVVDETTWAEIIFSKGKVKFVEFYSTLKDIGMVTIKIQ